MFLTGTVIGSFLLCVSVAGEGAVLKKFTETGNESYAKAGIFFLYFFAFVRLLSHQLRSISPRINLT